MKDTKSEINYPKHSRGPHNLGDPEDKTLRKVESNVLIPQKMRDRARAEKCTEEVKEFVECCKNAKLLMSFSCKKQNKALVACLSKWYNDPNFKEECKQQYLEERSQYRRTGIPVRKLGRSHSS